MQKTILIIGGGLLQLPLIKTARSMGLTVAVTDMDADAPGFALADHTIQVSTRDIDGTVREVRRFSQGHAVDGVVTAGTDASMTVAAVANVLDLPGIKFSDAEAASNKIKMRTRFHENGVPSPQFRAVWTRSDARKAAEELGLPLVVKPADNMGARGVIKVSSLEEVDQAYKHAKTNSPTGSVIVEQFMSGPELSVDALVYRGRIHITGIADRIIESEPYFVETGHNMPSSMPAGRIEEAVEVMKLGMKSLGIDHGAAKGDLKVTPEGVMVGELAARLSGGFMSSHTFPLSSGVNLLKAAIEVALDQDPGDLKPRFHRVAIERAIIGESGKLQDVDGVEEALQVKGIEEVILTKKPGDEVYRLTSNIGKIGHIIARGETLAEAEAAWREAARCIHLKIDSSYLINQKEINETAKKRFGNEACWVCKVCDGKNCASGVPGMGGIGRMVTFQNNLEALSRLQIRPSYIHSDSEPDITCSFFGMNLRSPIWAAPVTGVHTNMNGAIGEREYNDIICETMVESGSMPFVGDGASPDKYKIGLGALAAIKGQGVAIFKPRADWELLMMRMQAAEEAGIAAVGIDIDAVHFKTLKLKQQTTRSYNREELMTIRSSVSLPFILKGIMSVRDALLAGEIGADAIIVSNHGGRVLDHMPGTAQVLGEIAREIKSRFPQMHVFADGGIRSGEDVFKMMALGADAVLIGRPFCINAVGGGKPGLRFLLNQYNNGLLRCMKLSGLEKLDQITADCLEVLPASQR